MQNCVVQTPAIMQILVSIMVNAPCSRFEYPTKRTMTLDPDNPRSDPITAVAQNAAPAPVPYTDCTVLYFVASFPHLSSKFAWNGTMVACGGLWPFQVPANAKALHVGWDGKRG